MTNLLSYRFPAALLSTKPGPKGRTLQYVDVRHIVNHAGVTDALVSVTHEDGQLRIAVSDQGRGFNADVVANTEGQGLARIAHRLQLIGGHMQIESTVGKGMHVTLYVPLPSQQDT